MRERERGRGRERERERERWRGRDWGVVNGWIVDGVYTTLWRKGKKRVMGSSSSSRIFLLCASPLIAWPSKSSPSIISLFLLLHLNITINCHQVCDFTKISPFKLLYSNVILVSKLLFGYISLFFLLKIKTYLKKNAFNII